MNVLIVHAHPEPESFTSALMKAAIDVLSAAGHNVEITDLYAQHFNPVASAADFLVPQNAKYLVYALEQRHGLETGTLSLDIIKEIEKVRRCDLLLLTFPIYWFAAPAILKGWIDRVFVSGAFYGGRRIYEHGGMKGKKALVCATLGGRQAMVCDGGIHGDLEMMLRPLLQGTLGYVGFDVLKPHFSYHVPYVSLQERSVMLDQWRSELTSLEQRPVLQMPKIGDFDSTLSRRL
ncbi:NAD(P)H dehydrogenase [Cupriavidus taiwanensis]|uniref:NAD(P)H-dependent oxidoreductase n=1 Tax=Cupriavidus taiwanensis TaxID=164546 RepID=UPI000E162BE0|nr:NAD(P)H-dependent oxidoreductase [Cupriavidus taiwanensis]SPA32340.1 NAD(P)H dehydrogenase [Cupriavidus taiwanensis]